MQQWAQRFATQVNANLQHLNRQGLDFRRRIYSLELRQRLADEGRSLRMPLWFQGQFGEDLLLYDILGEKPDGLLIEVGAFDGKNLSVTYAMDAIGWNCLLIEAIPQRVEQCKTNRPHARVVHAALAEPGSPAEVEFTVTDDAIRDLIRYYTREAGVRKLEREIAKLARKALRRILEGKDTSVTVSSENLADFSGVRKFRYGLADTEDQIGAVTGLAWTEVGGDLLTIEAVTSPGKGAIKTTGKLGSVMTESISAALSFVRARATHYGIKPSVFEKKDIHVHVPEGATPKDGPSAGIAMVTAIISTLTGVAVKRDVAMTGEVTLRGRVLPIGGLKEKLLAALRGGITMVLIPAENEKDLADIPDNVKQGMTIVPVSHVDEVLALALTQPLVPIEWTEVDEKAAMPPAAVATEPAVRH